MAFSFGRFKELLKKYGKVALGVHFSVSTVSVTGLYVAINNNVDVEFVLEKVGIGGVSPKDPQPPPPPPPMTDEGFVVEQQADYRQVTPEKRRNRTAELTASSGGALALAVLCNKMLFPVRVPITLALTPPIARFLARRGITRSGV